MSRWFRHYAGMARDDKIVRASLKAGQPIERTAWVWAAILESAAEIDDGGRFELDAAEVAYFLRADEPDIARILSALADGGRIAGDHVVHWSDRQFQSDRSAERQRRHRDKQKAARIIGREYGETTTQRHRDVSVTSASRHGDAPEAETETEEDTRSLRSRESRAPEPPPPAEPLSPSAPEPSCRIEFNMTFWPAYPHKVGRPAALRAFIAKRQEASLAEIMDGLARYKSDRPPDRQWLNPETFLNDERFRDEPAPARVPNGAKSTGHDAILRSLARQASEGDPAGEWPPGPPAGHDDFGEGAPADFGAGDGLPRPALAGPR